MPQVEVNSSIFLEYQIFNEQLPETILFIHGLGSTGQDWEPQVSQFKSNYRIVVVDLRGHGKSSKPEDLTYTIEALANDCFKLLMQLRVNSSNVVGLSLGGFVALQLAIDYPYAVKSLVLINSAANLKPRTWNDHLKLGLRQLITNLPIPMSITARFIAAKLFSPINQQAQYSQAVERISANNRGIYQKMFRAALQYDVLKRLHEIKCPTLIIVGEKDQVLPNRFALELKEEIKNSKYISLPDAGHVANIDCADKVNALIQMFLVEQETNRF
ncbi:MAG: putative hydrolase, alpha/beta fold family [Chlamydiales bacterium]|jgi:3-oxoadipate enol-lactonase|nr:putative hydrolase, alpha/beta fold family [Chlamydiales bacterium]